jgi:hypothetical protein
MACFTCEEVHYLSREKKFQSLFLVVVLLFSLSMYLIHLNFDPSLFQ